MKKVFLSIGILLSVYCSAQDLKADMEKVAKNYSELKDYHFKMHVALYNSFTDKKPSQLIETEACAHDKNYYTAFGNQITLSTDKGDLIVNKDMKMLIYSKPKTAQEKKSLELDLKLPKQETLSSSKTEISWKGDDKNIRHYTVKMPNAEAEILQTDLYIDLDTWLIKRIDYIYNPKIYTSNNKVEVDYYYASFNPVFPADKFSLLPYLDFKTPDRPKAKGAYSKYLVEYK